MEEEFNRVLDFIGAPRVESFKKTVFTRPAIKTPQQGNLTEEAAQLLRSLYYNDTYSLYKRMGAIVPEWESWYLSRGLYPYRGGPSAGHRRRRHRRNLPGGLIHAAHSNEANP